MNTNNYLNNAGAGIMSDKTFDIIVDFMQLEREIGAYQAATESKKQIEEFYLNATQLINASSYEEIAFMDSASRAWDMAISGLSLKKGDKVLTLSSEFGTNLITLFSVAKQIDANIKVINCDINGNFSIEEIEKELKNGVKIIAISHSVAHGSIINPVEEIGILAKQYGATYIVDGCQAVGQFPVDVQAIQCDVYTATGRKWLCGPRGTGFLYVKKGAPFNSTQLDLTSADLILDDELIVKNVKVRQDARQFELWEKSYANLLGLSSAIKQFIDTDQLLLSEKIQSMANKLREIASKNPTLNIIGQNKSISGILGFYLETPESEIILLNEFNENGLRISTMSDWDCPMHFPKNGATKIFRLSPHYYTNETTISKACEVLSKVKNN